MNTRWKYLLPLVALIVASILIGLATMTIGAIKQRNALVLEGRVLGIAHGLERSLREDGLDTADAQLEAALIAAGPTIRGLHLSDQIGTSLGRAGDIETTLPRNLDVFVGRPGGGRNPGGPPRNRGRGRLNLEVFIEPDTETLPLAAALILPAVIIASIALVALALLGGALLDRQRKHAELSARQERLEALGRAGAGLAHQLRTPLATIKGSCQLIGESINDPEQIRRLEAAIREAGRMERMLSLLLDFARPPDAQPETINLKTVLTEVQTRHEGIDLEVEDPAELWADPDHLEQILANLVDNAKNFSPDEVKIEVDGTKGMTLISVLDRGPGPGPDPEHLFEPYVSNRADGTGLGLSIARNLAQANGGNVAIEERANGGSCATISLPRRSS